MSHPSTEVTIRFAPILRTADGMLKVSAVLPDGGIVEGLVPQGSMEEIALAAARLEPVYHYNGGGNVQVSRAAYDAAVAKGRDRRAVLAARPERVREVEDLAEAHLAAHRRAASAESAAPAKGEGKSSEKGEGKSSEK